MGSVVQKVANVYRSNSTTYRFHSRWVGVAKARRAVMSIGSYNYFRQKPVNEALNRIADKDPNAQFSIGREMSPVIYVQTEKPRSVIGVFSAIDGSHGPDELDKVTGGPHSDRYLKRLPKKKPSASVVRAWWD